MEVDMTREEVIEGLKRLRRLEGKNLSKKKVKKVHPELMRHALYYFSDWDHAKDSIS